MIVSHWPHTLSPYPDSKVAGTLTVKTTGSGRIQNVSLQSSTDVYLGPVVIDAAGQLYTENAAWYANIS